MCKKWKTKANPKIGEIRASIFALIQNLGLVVTFKKTEGHASDMINNRVDHLARAAAQEARHLSTSKDVPRLRLVLDVDGLDMEAADYILGATEKAGGIAQGSIEEIDAALEVVNIRTIDNNK
jgi:hypothetical protein